jgi:hypothetical protein
MEEAHLSSNPLIYCSDNIGIDHPWRLLVELVQFMNVKINMFDPTRWEVISLCRLPVENTLTRSITIIMVDRSTPESSLTCTAPYLGRWWQHFMSLLKSLWEALGIYFYSQLLSTISPRGRNNKFRKSVFLDLVILYRVFRTTIIIIHIFKIGPVIIQIRRIIHIKAIY